MKRSHGIHQAQQNFWLSLLTSLVVTAALLSTALPRPALAQDETANQAALRDFNATAALQNSGLYSRAAAKWANFLKLYPTDMRIDRVHYYLGICQLHTKKYAEAQQSFGTVLTKFPKFPSLDGAQYNLGMVHYQMASDTQDAATFVKAADAFNTLVTKYPQSKYADRALYFQGDSLILAAQAEKAIEPFTKLIAGHAKSSLLPDTYYSLGVTQQELGQDEAAVATLQKFLDNPALQQHALIHEVRLRQGMSYFKLQKYAEAEPLFAAAALAENFPYADFALLRQGQSQLEGGAPEKALPTFTKMLADFPTSAYRPAAQLSQGKIYFLTDKLAEAQQVLEPVAAAKVNESPEAAYWLGRTLLKMEKASDALARLDQAVKSFTEGEFAAYLALLRIDALYELADRRKETPPLYAAFVKQFPDHDLTAQSLYMAALSSLGQEDYAAARTHAEAFMANANYAQHELLPANLYIAAEAYLLPVAAKAEGGDMAKAEALYRKLVAEHPQHTRAPRSHLRIGWCLHEAKKYAESLKYLTDMLAKLPEPDQKAEAYLLIGRGHSSLQNEQPALAAYDAALKAKPDWPRVDEVLLASALSLRSLKNPTEATARLKKLTAEHPASSLQPQAIYQLGEIAQAEAKFPEAIAYYKQVLTKFPMSDFVGLANYGLGAAYFASADYASAVPPLNLVVALKDDPDLANQGKYLRGLTNQRLDQFAPALQDLQAFLTAEPQAAEALDARYAVALCQIGLDQHAEAVKTLSMLVKEAGDYAHTDKIYYELAHAYLALKQPEDANEAFESLATKLPASPLVAESQFHIGRYHEQVATDSEDEAIQKTEIATAAKAYTAGLAKAGTPELKEKLQYKLGDMQFRQAVYDQAAVTLQTQLKEHPTGQLVGPGRYLAAESLFRLAKYDQALPLFVQVANDKVENYHARSLYQAGQCAANLKNWPESQKHYTALIQQFPKFVQVADTRYGLAFALQQQNKLAEARPLYEQVTNETETETAAKARFMIGEICFAEKKYEEAIEHFLAVAVGYPYKHWQSLGQFEAGRCFVELDKKPQAIASFQTVVEKYPDQAEAKDAARLLGELQKP